MTIIISCSFSHALLQVLLVLHDTTTKNDNLCVLRNILRSYFSFGVVFHLLTFTVNSWCAAVHHDRYSLSFIRCEWMNVLLFDNSNKQFHALLIVDDVILSSISHNSQLWKQQFLLPLSFTLNTMSGFDGEEDKMPIKQADRLIVRDYITALDHLQYTQLPEDVVSILLTHSNLPAKHVDIRLKKHMTVLVHSLSLALSLSVCVCVCVIFPP